LNFSGEQLLWSTGDFPGRGPSPLPLVGFRRDEIPLEMNTLEYQQITIVTFA
jgi:hypothetical protein